MWTGIPESFPFFGRKERPPLSASTEEARIRHPPVLSLSLDRKVYRPGDAVTATVEICNNASAPGCTNVDDEATNPILVEDLVVEVRGTEKLDPQWILTPKSASGVKQRRGERVFLESHGPIVRNVVVDPGSIKSYLARITLPKVLPPSYRGTAVRYFYHLTARVRWTVAPPEIEIWNGSTSSQATIPLEKRIALTVWTMPNNSGLTADELHFKESYGSSGIVPLSLVEMEMQWKENNGFSEWSRTASVSSGGEDDVLNQGSESIANSPVKGNLENTFDRLILQSPSMTPRGQPKESRSTTRKTATLTASYSDAYLDMEQRNPQQTLDRSSSGNRNTWNRSVVDGYFSEQDDDSRVDSPLGYIKGKAYNIRLDDEVLVRIAPKNPDAIHYFGDTVAGVVSFPDDNGSRKCLELSAVLEVREILNPSHLHPSRRNSQVITKVQSEYHEVVADVSQTYFLFSVPLDGPASFSTPHITVQWVLRFEFLATAANVDWTKYAHPLQAKERDRGEWTMPITVHAPLPRTHGAVRKDRPVSSLRDFWIQSPKASEWVGTPQGSPAGPSNGHLKNDDTSAHHF